MFQECFLHLKQAFQNVSLLICDFFYVLRKINVILREKNGSETFAFLHTLSKFNCGHRTAQVISFTGDTSTENRTYLLKFLEKDILVS